MFFELWQRVNLRIINNPQGEMPSQFGAIPAVDCLRDTTTRR